MSLTLVREGAEASITRVDGKEGVGCYLENMGFISGASVVVVPANNGNAAVNMEESGVVISKGMANKIIVWTGRGYEKERNISRIHTLEEVKCKSAVTVVKPHGEGAVRRHIMGMGITKGAEVYVRKVAPLGGPVEMNVRDYKLSLGKADAEMVGV